MKDFFQFEGFCHSDDEYTIATPLFSAILSLIFLIFFFLNIISLVRYSFSSSIYSSRNGKKDSANSPKKSKFSKLVKNLWRCISCCLCCCCRSLCCERGRKKSVPKIDFNPQTHLLKPSDELLKPKKVIAVSSISLPPTPQRNRIINHRNSESDSEDSFSENEESDIEIESESEFDENYQHTGDHSEVQDGYKSIGPKLSPRQNMSPRKSYKYIRKRNSSSLIVIPGMLNKTQRALFEEKSKTETGKNEGKDEVESVLSRMKLYPTTVNRIYIIFSLLFLCSFFFVRFFVHLFISICGFQPFNIDKSIQFSLFFFLSILSFAFYVPVLVLFHYHLAEIYSLTSTNVHSFVNVGCKYKIHSIMFTVFVFVFIIINASIYFFTPIFFSSSYFLDEDDPTYDFIMEIVLILVRILFFSIIIILVVIFDFLIVFYSYKIQSVLQRQWIYPKLISGRRRTDASNNITLNRPKNLSNSQSFTQNDRKNTISKWFILSIVTFVVPLTINLFVSFFLYVVPLSVVLEIPFFVYNIFQVVLEIIPLLVFSFMMINKSYVDKVNMILRQVAYGIHQ